MSNVVKVEEAQGWMEIGSVRSVMKSIKALVRKAEAQRIANCIQRPEAEIYDYLFTDEYWELEDSANPEELDAYTAKVQSAGLVAELLWRAQNV